MDVIEQAILHRLVGFTALYDLPTGGETPRKIAWKKLKIYFLKLTTNIWSSPLPLGYSKL